MYKHNDQIFTTATLILHFSTHHRPQLILNSLKLACVTLISASIVLVTLVTTTAENCLQMLSDIISSGNENMKREAKDRSS